MAVSIWHRYDVGDIDVDGDLDIVVLKSIPLGTGIDWHENINGQLIDAAPLWAPTRDRAGGSSESPGCSNAADCGQCNLAYSISVWID